MSTVIQMREVDDWDKLRAEDRPQYGEQNSLAKLTNEQAARIRNDPRSERVLGKIYGVDHMQIGRIKRGESYPAAAPSANAGK